MSNIPRQEILQVLYFALKGYEHGTLADSQVAVGSLSAKISQVYLHMENFLELADQASPPPPSGEGGK